MISKIFKVMILVVLVTSGAFTKLINQISEEFGSK